MAEEQQSTNKNIERLTTQVRETYKKAFFDLLEEKIGQDPPDYEWLTRLYGEIRTKLITLLKQNSPLRKEIKESMDCEFFYQLISNNVFSPENFYNLIRYVFEKCKQLGSPARDSETDVKLKEIVDRIPGGSLTSGLRKTIMDWIDHL